MSNALRFCVALVVLGGVLAAAQADVVEWVVLEDRNSTASINPASSDGMFEWTVDGTDHLTKQWFWYRTEGMDHERPLNEMGLIGTSTTNTNPWVSDDDNQLTAAYGDLNGFFVETMFSLQGGSQGSNASDIAEQIGFYNNTDETIKLWFFQYVDFDLDGNTDTAWIEGGNTAYQTSEGVTVSETVVVRKPDRHEVNYFDNTLASLMDDEITELNNESGQLTGDVTWAFEWYIELAPGKSANISKDKNIIPEPATMAMLAIGGLAILGQRRRRS